MTELNATLRAARRSRTSILSAALLDGVALADAPRAGVVVLRAWTRPATASRPAGVIVSEVRPGAPRGAFYAAPAGYDDARARLHALRVHCVRFGLSVDHTAGADHTATYCAARRVDPRPSAVILPFPARDAVRELAA